MEHKQSLIPPHPQPFSAWEKGVRISFYTESPFSAWEKGFRDAGNLIMNSGLIKLGGHLDLNIFNDIGDLEYSDTVF